MVLDDLSVPAHADGTLPTPTVIAHIPTALGLPGFDATRLGPPATRVDYAGQPALAGQLLAAQLRGMTLEVVDMSTSPPTSLVGPTTPSGFDAMFLGGVEATASASGTSPAWGPLHWHLTPF